MTNSMQAILSKVAIYTKQPTREWEDRYLTWGCANVLLRLYESERGSERSNVLLLNMYESLWEYEVLWELLREVLWELLRFCDSSCWRCESCWGSVIQVVEGVRDVWCSQNILWYIWELYEVWESFLLLVQYSLNTSQNRQNMHMTRQQTWPHKHNHC